MSDIHYYTTEQVMMPELTAGGEPTGNMVAKTIYQSNAGSVGGERGVMRFCAVCALEYRESDMIAFRGRWYCKERMHVHEIASILKDEAARRYKPNNSNERPGPGIIVR